jgi:hypothetical protein
VTEKLAFSRNRAPIGGRLALLPEPAECLAGQMNASLVGSAVNLIACVIGVCV